MTTLTTVGYGDICPAIDVERMYELGALLITALIFATLLSTISELVAKVDSQAALADEKIEAARDFMNYYKMPRELRAKASRASSQRTAPAPADRAWAMRSLLPWWTMPRTVTRTALLPVPTRTSPNVTAPAPGHLMVVL